MDEQIDKIIYDALEEDIPTIDITTDNLFKNEVSEGVFIAEEDGVLSGVKVLQRIFQILDDDIYIKVINGDGIYVEKGDIIAIIKGRTSSILKGKRISLNLLQRMSGVATLTKKFVEEISNMHTKILDTRHTTPNLRVLEKQAVVDGGGINHRMSLSDQVLLNENHIAVAGSIARAVEIVKSNIDQSIKVEVEVQTFDQFIEALQTDCDIIMLGNMSNDLMRKCVGYNSNKLLEASGNMTIDRIKSVSETGVDFISVEALTHSYKVLDISLKFSK